MAEEIVIAMRLLLAVSLPIAVLVTLIAAVAGRPFGAILKWGAIVLAVLMPLLGAILGGVPTHAGTIPGLVFGSLVGLVIFVAVLITALMVGFVRLLFARPSTPRLEQPAPVLRPPPSADDSRQRRLATLSRDYWALSVTELERLQREAVLAPDAAALCQRIIDEKRGAVVLDMPELTEPVPRTRRDGPNRSAQNGRAFSPCGAGFGLGLLGAFLTLPLGMFGAAFLGNASPLLSPLLQIVLPIGVFVLVFIKVCMGPSTPGPIRR